jgi:hypothetical protein
MHTTQERGNDMFCKVACRTDNGLWFLWDDMLFSSPARAWAYIDTQKEYIRDDLFVVIPNRNGTWEAM